jgi:hypothetical protein
MYKLICCICHAAGARHGTIQPKDVDFRPYRHSGGWKEEEFQNKKGWKSRKWEDRALSNFRKKKKKKTINCILKIKRYVQNPLWRNILRGNGHWWLLHNPSFDRIPPSNILAMAFNSNIHTTSFFFFFFFLNGKPCALAYKPIRHAGRRSIHKMTRF